MFPKGESLESEVAISSIWIQDDLIASMPFEILKDPVEYEKEKNSVSQKVLPIFVKRSEQVIKTLDSLRNYNSFLKDIIDADIKSPSRNSYQNTILTEGAFQSFRKIRKRETQLSSRLDNSLIQIFNLSSEAIEKIYSNGLLNVPLDTINKDTVSLRDGKFQRIFLKSNFFDRSITVDYLNTQLAQSGIKDKELKSAIKEYISFFLVPDIYYSKELTEEAKVIARDKISGNRGIVNENERIVAKHDRITPEIKAKIDSYRIAKGAETGFWGTFAQNMGKLVHVILIFVLFVIYIHLFRKKIFNDNFKILLIAIIILFVSGQGFLVSQLNVKGPIEYLILVPVASMLITIMFDSRVGFYSTIVISLIIGALRGNDYALTVTSIVAGGLGAYTVRDIKNRNQIFRSFIFILIGYVASIIAFGLERFESYDQLLISSAFAASNSILSPALTFGLIIFIEKMFKITTDLTLLELSDFNSPALKELARSAPGTFTHSMTIGSMVESAAEVIGANPILARVGAYYHDIGKSANPTGFVENQVSDVNIHEKLEPTKSAELIIQHVKRGMELGEKYNLPKEIIDFIPMHHGTMVVTYFYEKAKELSGKENVNIKDFRYPGPKPNSKETALLMFADACESAVRAMVDPDPQKVENVINNLIKIRLDDGQLDDSPITLSDIKKVKESFLAILIGQTHKRIRYPKQDELESNLDEEAK